MVTPHFALGRNGRRLVLAHTLRQVDNDVCVLLAQELFAPGWVDGTEAFERLMTGVVLSCHDDAVAAWEAFYRASLARLRSLCSVGADHLAAGPAADRSGEGAIAGFAPVYRRALDLVREAGTRTLLDLGTCFGFFPLLMASEAASAAAPASEVCAADLCLGSCVLLGRMARRLGTPVPVLACDADDIPVSDDGMDTVTLLHVLEHVGRERAERILGEVVRVARRRVVIAVPLESVPDATFGHVQAITTRDLQLWGESIATRGPWEARVEEYHGGWLMLDRRLPARRSACRA